MKIRHIMDAIAAIEWKLCGRHCICIYMSTPAELVTIASVYSISAARNLLTIWEETNFEKFSCDNFLGSSLSANISSRMMCALECCSS